MKRSSYELEVCQRKKRKIFLLSGENWLSKWLFFAESAIRPHGLKARKLSRILPGQFNFWKSPYLNGQLSSQDCISKNH